MNPLEKYLNRIKSGLALPWWFTTEITPVNPDFSKRVVSLADSDSWRPTQIEGIQLRVLEYIPGAKPRLTGQIRLNPDSSPALLGENPDLELLVQRGEIVSSVGAYPAGLYLRLPVNGEENLQALTLCCTANDEAAIEPALVYVAAGQMLTSDTEQRRIDTTDNSRWLPGPVEDTEVLPLHGHGSGNVMLIRWNQAVTFKPKLDPMGEEVLVLQGSLSDAAGHYPAGSWIRNPVTAWQSWSATQGTVVYYKNGHLNAPD